MISDEIRDNSYVAVVIAAGLSSRMGEFKPLLDIGGRPALARLLDSIRAAGIKQILVITGYKRGLIEKDLEKYSSSDIGEESLCNNYRLLSIYNHVYEEGMFSSIKAGIRYIAGLQRAAGMSNATRLNSADCVSNVAEPNKYSAALLFPVDVPLVSAETIRGLLQNWEKSAMTIDTPSLNGEENALAKGNKVLPGFAVPVYEGKNGHPLLIPDTYFDEVLNYDGEGGLKAVRSRHETDMIRYPVDDAGCVLDMDTPDDYKRIREYYEKQRL